MRSPVIRFGKSSWVYRDDLFAVMAIIVIFLIGALMVQVGKRMDAEVEAQRQVELLAVERDERFNDSLVD